MIRYMEIRPAPALATHVECFWAMRGWTEPGQQLAHRVLPDNCIDIVFRFGDTPAWAGGPGPALHAWFVGTMTSALRIVHSGCVDVLGVRFRPGRAAPFLPAPARVFTDSHLDLRDAWRGAGDVADALSAQAPRDRMAMLETVLERRLRASPCAEPDALVDAALSRLRRSGGSLPIADLEDGLATTQRTLERRFAAAMGIAPKLVARVVRLQAAVAAIRGRRAGLAGIAFDTGFADQAHMTREFQALAGTTPAAWARENGVGFVQDGTPTAA